MKKKSIYQLILFVIILVILVVEGFIFASLININLYILNSEQSNEMANLLNTKGEFSDDWKDIETSKSIKKQNN